MNRRLTLIAGITVIITAYIIIVTVFAADSIKENIQKQTQKPGNMDETKSEGNPEYMLLGYRPGEIDTPEAVLRAYFDALKTAANLTEKQMAAVGGTVGRGLEPYQQAYQYWSKDWQGENSFQEFLDSWQGTTHVQLLKLLPTGQQNDQKRFFVETRHIEVAKDKPRTGVFYYTGFFTVGKTREGWRITGGSIEPQNLAWKLGGHQPWRSDPVMVAIVDGLGLGMQARVGKPVVLDNPDGTVTVEFFDDNVSEKHRVVLYRPQDGMWRVLEKASGELQN